MPGDTDNPRIWVNGAVFVAPTGTTLPTTVSAALNVAFVDLGLTSEDGFTQSSSTDSTDYFARGGILVRSRRSKKVETFQVMALEDTPAVADLVHPGLSMATTGGVTTRHIPGTIEVNRKAFVIEESDGDTTRRIIIENGEVTEVGDRVSSDSEMTMFPLTITCYPDDDGYLYTEITDADSAEVAVSS